MSTLAIAPISITSAREMVNAWHEHHRAPVSGLFAASVTCDGVIVGVAIAGRPVARMSDDGFTVEVTRVAINRSADDVKNACSMLYGAIRGAARALGYKRVLTYTLESEPGTSPRAAGFRCVGVTNTSEGWLSHPRTALTPPLLAAARGESPEVCYPVGRKARWEWP